jgi:alpha-N-arabinofuranosidase
LCNLSAAESAEIECELRGMDASSVSGSIITAPEMDAHNTFESPEVVKPAEFGGASARNGVLKATLPPKSVVVLAVK